MFDMASVTKHLSKAERHFIEWLDENGFDGKVIKQYQSKTEFRISKDGVEDTVNLPNIDLDVSVFCNSFARQFETLKELHHLRREYKEHNETADISMEDKTESIEMLQ